MLYFSIAVQFSPRHKATKLHKSLESSARQFYFSLIIKRNCRRQTVDQHYPGHRVNTCQCVPYTHTHTRTRFMGVNAKSIKSKAVAAESDACITF